MKLKVIRIGTTQGVIIGKRLIGDRIGEIIELNIEQYTIDNKNTKQYTKKSTNNTKQYTDKIVDTNKEKVSWVFD